MKTNWQADFAAWEGDREGANRAKEHTQVVEDEAKSSLYILYTLPSGPQVALSWNGLSQFKTLPSCCLQIAELNDFFLLLTFPWAAHKTYVPS